MATEHLSIAQLNNTTFTLATMSLEKQSPRTPVLASASNEASSLMNPAADKESEDKVKVAVYELIALATVQRPLVRITVDELFRTCISLLKTSTTQSDASSIIADILRRLNIVVGDEAGRMASTDHEKTLDVLTKWNAALANFFAWDEHRNQFLAPLQVLALLQWLVNFQHHGKRLAKMWTERENKLYRAPPGGLQDAINFFVTSELRPDTSTEEQESQSATPVLPALSRQSIEHLVTYTFQEDTLDFLWYDEEEEDTFYIEQSEDEDSHHSNEIFGFATEISGAEVTDSDWSEINCM